ncbi:DUF3107 domain-containing protein [Mycolicibacterium brumae]|uniref:DUF3107 domain-containing protein n=1 Tax=Mycolicibacterium brumae TaxID=85968 RepID=A0A2G5PC35_9MYCO|nr:DUF3107 domain-containing protein [Mycolicibacterium brumae]MCV7193183.1 DUF3107 domain-containing protein [Mycolicibacterium brumae]PIB75906.1 DUF3107 domain-containing protein [Mycolicibacterium brumae]RWA16621.1 hypothetical protein MBRU_07810 [Mycolicibacterium brumae DSM 44177]UWW09838.1 DUF3107 domain-containing protein [Mycolicibacterium brumae]
MDVKIGITDSPRELVFASEEKPELLEKQIHDALGSEGASVLSLTDEKGRKFIVATQKIAYVELGPADGRRVGFGK